MKQIAIFLDAPDFDDYPFSKEEYREAYYAFAKVITERGGIFWIVRAQETYRGGMSFSQGWKYVGNEFVHSTEVVTVDVVYNKGHLVADSDATIVNDPQLYDLCRDKEGVHNLFPDLSPQTLTVHSVEELQGALAEWNGEIIVAKPVDGAEGEGVFVGSPEELETSVPHFPYLLQEFLDTSQGIPGIIESTHDFRIVSISGKIILAFVRTPPEGELRANVAQGGETHDVDVANIPDEATALFRRIDAACAQFPQRVYSVDMARCSDGTWKLIELNAQPALFSPNRGPGFQRFQEALAEMLLCA